MNFAKLNFPRSDLDFIIRESEFDLENFQNTNILITGATGFIGKWIIESLLYYKYLKRKKINITILTRNPSSQNLFLQKGIDVILGDIVTFKIPKINYDFVLHGATPSVLETGGGDEKLVKIIIERGTQNLLDQISNGTLKPNFLFLSSGAVYGKNNVDKPMIEMNIDENNLPDLTLYGIGKLNAEKLVSTATKENIIRGCSPRLFAFSGPHLSLKEHFAFGNLILNAVKNEPFIIKGNPSTTRSYLYISELVSWMFKAMVSPTTTPVNFGNDQPISILDLAKTISKLTSRAPVQIISGARQINPNYYYPDIFNTKKIYEVIPKISLEQQIINFYNWAMFNYRS